MKFCWTAKAVEILRSSNRLISNRRVSAGLVCGVSMLREAAEAELRTLP